MVYASHSHEVAVGITGLAFASRMENHRFSY